MPVLLTKSVLFKRLVLLFAAVLLSACQTVQKPAAPDDSGWQRDAEFFAQPLAQYQQRSAWRFSAKVAVKTPDTRDSANLVWRYNDQSNQVRLFGPLGAGAVKIDFDRYGVQLSDSNGVRHRGGSAEELLTRIVGWPIPIDALSYWLFGLPLPEKSFGYRTAETGELSQLRQLGWTISYTDYRDYSLGRLARKLTAVKQLTPEQAVTVKLIAKSWQ